MGDKISVAGIAEKNGTFLVMRRVPGGAVGGRWEFPGGKVEPGEEPCDALAREWREELNAVVTVGKIMARGEFRHDEDAYELLGFSVSPPPAKPALREHDEYRWVTPDELRRLDLVESDRVIAGALAGDPTEETGMIRLSREDRSPTP